MKTKTKILVGIVALIVVFGVGLFIWEQQPTQFTVAVTGQSGLAFTGVIKVDGTAMPVAGVVPTNYVVTARAVDCRFEKQLSGSKIGVCLKMKRWNGASCAVTSKLGRGVYAFLSLHNAYCNTF